MRAGRFGPDQRINHLRRRPSLPYLSQGTLRARKDARTRVAMALPGCSLASACTAQPLRLSGNKYV